MAPSKKSKSVNKKYLDYREAAPSKDKYAENASKNKLKASPGIQKKIKLADMLGRQWSKEELEHFYEAYRKYGKDWKKVALAVRNRSIEMVEALYTMNRAYLSLPEGTASVVGLIAMMTDHYSVMGGGDSEKESNEEPEVSKKSKKRLRGKQMDDNKALDGHFSDHSQSQSVASGDGCLSLLKKRNSGLRPHAVRKRTPRVPISHSIGKDSAEKLFSFARQGYKQMVDTNDVAHKIALALTEASQRGGSSKVSGSPDKRTTASPSQKSGKKHGKSEIAGSKFCNTEMDDGSSELSLGSTEGDNGDYSRTRSHWTNRENIERGKNQEKRIKHYGKTLEPEENLNKHLDDVKEASSGTDDGKNLSFIKSRFSADFADAKNTRPSYKGSKKKSKKLLVEKDEASAIDALKTLADLSLMMPVTNPDTESIIDSNMASKSKLAKFQKSLASDAASTMAGQSRPPSCGPLPPPPLPLSMEQGPPTEVQLKRHRLEKQLDVEQISRPGKRLASEATTSPDEPPLHLIWSKEFDFQGLVDNQILTPKAEFDNQILTPKAEFDLSASDLPCSLYQCMKWFVWGAGVLRYMEKTYGGMAKAISDKQLAEEAIDQAKEEAKEWRDKAVAFGHCVAEFESQLKKNQETWDARKTKLEEDLKASAERLKDVEVATSSLRAQLSAAEHQHAETVSDFQHALEEMFGNVMGHVTHLAPGLDFGEVGLWKKYDPKSRSIRLLSEMEEAERRFENAGQGVGAGTLEAGGAEDVVALDEVEVS